MCCQSYPLLIPCYQTVSLKRADNVTQRDSRDSRTLLLLHFGVYEKLRWYSVLRRKLQCDIWVIQKVSLKVITDCMKKVRQNLSHHSYKTFLHKERKEKKKIKKSQLVSFLFSMFINLFIYQKIQFFTIL